MFLAGNRKRFAAQYSLCHDPRSFDKSLICCLFFFFFVCFCAFIYFFRIYREYNNKMGKSKKKKVSQKFKSEGLADQIEKEKSVRPSSRVKNRSRKDEDDVVSIRNLSNTCTFPYMTVYSITVYRCAIVKKNFRASKDTTK